MKRDKPERRLAAILAADVVGFSRLMERDEIGTLFSLKQIRDGIIEPQIDANNGRIVKLIGDGTLVEFASVVDAVSCAVAIQEGMSARNSNAQDDECIELRIGVHLGDVIVDGEDIYGDGVNLAARLEGRAQAGGICISQQAYDQIETKLDLVYNDLGEQRLKNIERPVRAYEVGSLQSHKKQPREAPALVPAQRPAVAVLPFNNVSNNPEQEYFADGLTEDLITALAHWRSLPVIARNSSFAYKDQVIDTKVVGRELGAQYILEGSIRRSGNRVRVTAQLIDGSNGHHLWAEKYDRDFEDIFEVQDDIVQRIASILVPELDKAELLRVADKKPEELDVWDLYLRAKPLLREKSAEGNAKARELFLQAVSMKPDYADAHAGLAQSYNQDITLETIENRSTLALKAMEAARCAILHNEASSWAHHELSTALQWLNRIDDALDEARIAVELNPNDAYALHALGNKSDLAGDPNGIAYMEKAQKLNPEDAQRYTHLTFLARAYFAIGNHDAAIDRARQAIRRKPDFVPAHYILGIALGASGRRNEAKASLEKCDALAPGFVDSRRDWRPYSDNSTNEALKLARNLSGG